MKRMTNVLLVLACGLSLAAPSYASTKHKHHTKRPIAVISRVNINTATEAQLMRLPHIDEATADKIVAGRPWNDAKDLVTKGVITQDVYDDIHLKVSSSMPKSKDKE
jgi:DNA uptake protein ComE-like DNA-binding protein